MREPMARRNGSRMLLATALLFGVAMAGCASGGEGGLLGGGADETTTSAGDPTSTQPRDPDGTTTSAGGPERTTTTTAGTDALVEALAPALDFTGSTEEQRTCMAEAAVDQFGAERFADADITVERLEAEEAFVSDLDFTEEEAEDLVRSMIDCGAGDTLESFVEDDVLSEADEPSGGLVQCVDDAVGTDAIVAYWGNLLRDGAELSEDLDELAPAYACFASD